MGWVKTYPNKVSNRQVNGYGKKIATSSTDLSDFVNGLLCLWVFAMFGGYFLFGDGGIWLEVVASDLAVGIVVAMGMDLGGFFNFSKRVALLGLLSLCSNV